MSFVVARLPKSLIPTEVVTVILLTSLGGVEGVGGGDPLYLGGQGGVAQQPLDVDRLHAAPEHGLRSDLRPEAGVADVKQAAWNEG